MSFLADTFIGRCLLWRTPTDRDHLRFPAEPAGAPGDAAPLPVSASLRRAADLQLPAAGAWPGGSLDALLRTTGTTAFVLLHEGAIACEWFAPGSDGHTVRRTMSVTKSVASVLVGQAIGAGRIPDVDTRIGDLVDGIADPGVAALTLAQLLRMASGIGFRAGAVPWSSPPCIGGPSSVTPGSAAAAPSISAATARSAFIRVLRPSASWPHRHRPPAAPRSSSEAR